MLRPLTKRWEIDDQCTMQQGLSFLGKAITKCLTLEIHFSANSHLIHDFFVDEALLNFQKLENEENKVLNISFRECKTRKNVKGLFFTDKTGLNHFVFICAMMFAFITFVKNTPLWRKKRFKSLKKKIFSKYLISFLDAAGGQISDL